MKHVVIIGAGPAGLAAADSLAQRHVSLSVCEAQCRVGGLSQTISRNNFLFDIGPHRFFTQNPRVMQWWEGLLGDDFISVKRTTRIYFGKQFFAYPLTLRDVFTKLPVMQSGLAAGSYLKSRIRRRTLEESFEDWVAKRFGKRLYRLFFKNYTEKLWGIPCTALSADWAAQRIEGLSFSEALKNTLRPGKSEAKTLAGWFHYPCVGAGSMYEAAGKRILGNGAAIALNTEVTSVLHNGRAITAVVLRNNECAAASEVALTDLCSSMPLNIFVSLLVPRPPEAILLRAAQLRFRSMVIVYCIVRERHVFADQWIYIQDPDFTVSRIVNYKNCSARMVPDDQYTSLGLEYFCDEGDALWKDHDARLIDLAKHELISIGFVAEKDIIDAFVVRVPNAYPLYSLGYRAVVDELRGYLRRFTNLQCIGRAGMFRYNNMDHSVMMGLRAADICMQGEEGAGALCCASYDQDGLNGEA